MRNRDKIILDLCGGTGNWSQFYRRKNYDVRVVDPAPRKGLKVEATDVRLLYHPGKVHGILAAPPCTVFAASGARWPRTAQDYTDALSVVDACLRLVVTCQPEWWVLENPVGKLVRWLGKPVMYFNPCDYGDPYTKRTALWGRFNIPEQTPVEPTEGSKMHRLYGGRSFRTKRARSATPLGFARAFTDANP